MMNSDKDDQSDDNINSDHEISSFSEISFELTDKEKAECMREFKKGNQGPD